MTTAAADGGASGLRPGTQTAFHVDVFEVFGDVGIKYCVLRNYDQLPYSFPGHDIDILVGEDHLLKCQDILADRAGAHGAVLIPMGRSRDQVIVCIVGHSSDLAWSTTFDLQSSLSWKGVRFFNSEEVFAHSFHEGGVLKAARDHALAIAILNDVLLSKRVKDRYRQEALENDGEIPLSISGSITGAIDARSEEALRELFEGGRRSLRRSDIWRIRSRFLWDGLIHSTFETCRNIFSYLLGATRRRVKPPGLQIAVLGVDGSGKSTLIGEVAHSLRQLLHSRVVVMQFRPGLLPRPGLLINSQASSRDSSNPHGRNLLGYPGSLLMIAYHSLDYLLGYWLKVRPVKVGSGGIVLFDRYFFDYLIDPVRHRVNLPLWLIKVFHSIIPRPDLVFALCAPGQDILSRKAELTLFDVKSQQADLRRLASKDHQFVLVDAKMDAETVAHQVLGQILDRLARATPDVEH